MRTIYEVLNKAEAARTEEAMIRSTMDLVVAFRKENSDALQQLRRYDEEGGERVRRMVVAALAYRSWPGGILLLGEIAKSDPDDFIRQQAAKTARQWREHASEQDASHRTDEPAGSSERARLTTSDMRSCLIQ